MTKYVTKNVLSDFDMALSLSQAAINTQFGYAWRAWKVRNKFQDRLVLQATKVVDGEEKKSPYKTEVTFAAPQINLAVSDGKFNQVELVLTLKDGTVTYNDEFEGSTTKPIKGWRLTVLVDLDKKPVDVVALQKLDPDAAKNAADFMKNSSLPESVFSIEYLFMELTNIDLMAQDNRRYTIPAGVPSGAIDQVKKDINRLLSGQIRQFVLGVVVRQNAEQQVIPTFAVTDLIFSVHGTVDPTRGDAVSLDYLTMMQGRALPGDQNGARGRVTSGWLGTSEVDGSEESVSGVMVIRKGRFMDEYLMPRISNVLGVKPTNSGRQWTFSQDLSPVEVKRKDLLEHKFTQNAGYTLTFTASTNSSTLAISGKVTAGVHYIGKTLGGVIKVQSFDYEGYMPLSGTLTFQGNGIATDFNITPNVNLIIGETQVTKNEDSGLWRLNEDITSFLKTLKIIAGTPQEILESATNGIRQQLSQQLAASLQEAESVLKNQAFIPPAGGVFTFQKPQFTEAADLMLDVIYQAP